MPPLEQLPSSSLNCVRECSLLLESGNAGGLFYATVAVDCRCHTKKTMVRIDSPRGRDDQVVIYRSYVQDRSRTADYRRPGTGTVTEATKSNSGSGREGGLSIDVLQLKRSMCGLPRVVRET
jgi:nitrous oxide reductase accessory protein NosL